jgi:hypothetical protein
MTIKGAISGKPTRFSNPSSTNTAVNLSPTYCNHCKLIALLELATRREQRRSPNAVSSSVFYDRCTFDEAL